MTAAILLVAIVAEDPAVMRNAPRDDAAPQATLWRGDWLEVRGEKAGFLQVYDHRHERPGFIRPSIVRVHRLDEASAPELRAVVRFLRDAAGSESLGIGYGALYLRAAPAGADASEVLAAIGTMASRLARRASARRADGRDAALPGASPVASTVAAQIEVAESYGVHFRSVDPLLAGGRVRLCYDGDAWERVLSAPAAPALERARARSSSRAASAWIRRRRPRTAAPGTIAASGRSNRSTRRRRRGRSRGSFRLTWAHA